MSAGMTEGQHRANGLTLDEHSTTDKCNCVSATAFRKRFATIAASLALKGYELHRQHDGLLIARWGMHKTVDDLDEAALFLKKIGGAV